MVRVDISWLQAIILSVISLTAGFFLFLFLQVIWGDVLKETLTENYQNEIYFNINLIIIIGVIFVFMISFLTNLFIFRDYTIQSKLISNIFALTITFIVLFFLSWIFIVLFYPELYGDLLIMEKLSLSSYFFAIFAIYLLPSPVLFWQIALLIYHLTLIVFIRYFFKKKHDKFGLKSNKKQSRKKAVDINKYNMI